VKAVVQTTVLSHGRIRDSFKPSLVKIRAAILPKPRMMKTLKMNAVTTKEKEITKIAPTMKEITKKPPTTKEITKKPPTTPLL